MAADLIKIDLTDVQDSLQGNWQQSFQLTSYDNADTLVLASGRTEEVGDYLYRVEGGDLTVTDATGASGTRYLHILDDGDDTASAYLSTNAGTWDSNKGGYYHTDGAKVIFELEKNTALENDYNDVRRRNKPRISFEEPVHITKLNVNPGDYLIYSATSLTDSTTSSTYVKIKDLLIHFGGYIRIKLTFNMFVSATGTGYVQIYRNGVAVGTEQSTTLNAPAETTATEDIAGWEKGDNLQVYARHNPGGGSNFVILTGIYLYHGDSDLNADIIL